MPHYDELYPGRFLKGTQLPGPTVIRIRSIKLESLEGDDGTAAKGVLQYDSANGPGEIVWCKTNAILTANALGTPDYTEWARRLLTIHNDESVMFGSERVGGIRVFGSPELDRDKRVEIKRPRRRRPDVYMLRRTDKHGRIPGSDKRQEAEDAAHDMTAGEMAGELTQ